MYQNCTFCFPNLLFEVTFIIVLKLFSARNLKNMLKLAKTVVFVSKTYLFKKCIQKKKIRFFLEGFALIQARAGPIWARKIKRKYLKKKGSNRGSKLLSLSSGLKMSLQVLDLLKGSPPARALPCGPGWAHVDPSRRGPSPAKTSREIDISIQGPGNCIFRMF